MASNKQTIRIESILGGHSPTTHFAASDQFLFSIGINPAIGTTDPVTNNSANFTEKSSGLLRPTASKQAGGDTLNGAPKWMVSSPKNSQIFVYDNVGSVYTLNPFSNATITSLGDLNDAGTSSGNGAAYYDNYMYFARDTTIARYGPLNGSPSFTDDYWVGTLGKTALSNPTYPNYRSSGFRYPNHILHRHSDGKLYILDVLDNQGTIHYIQTSKTTVEGDTDAGSTYDKVNVGYGLWPTAIESYGSSLVVAFMEGDSSGFSTASDTTLRAKLAFWDTVSSNINDITWVEYPDPFISGIENINGVLYFTSGSKGAKEGLRIVKYIGGNSFEEVYQQESSNTPPQGAFVGNSNRLLFGATVENPGGTSIAGVFSYGLQKTSLGLGIFHVHRVTNSTTSGSGPVLVTALSLDDNEQFSRQNPYVGWRHPDTGSGIDEQSQLFTYGAAPSEWYSQLYRIGQPFKITKISIPLEQPLTSNMTIIPSVWLDGINSSREKVLTTINSTNYGTTKQNIVIRPQDLSGDNNFFLKLEWTGTALCVVSLPIIIEYELIDVDTQRP